MTDKEKRSDGKSGKTTLTLKAPSGLSSRGPSRGARTVVVERIPFPLPSDDSPPIGHA